jgi:hypothetical protein
MRKVVPPDKNTGWSGGELMKSTAPGEKAALVV